MPIGDFRCRQFCWTADQTDGLATGSGVIHCYLHVPRGYLWIGEYLIDVVDGAATDLVFFQFFEPISGCLLSHDVIKNLGQRIAVSHAGLVGDKPVVTEQFGHAREFAIALKLLIITHGNDDVAVGGWKNLVRHNVGVGVAEQSRHVS